MNLQLWLQNELVGKVYFDERGLRNQLYIESKKGELLRKYIDQVEAADAVPEFFIQAISKMNDVQKHIIY